MFRGFRGIVNRIFCRVLTTGKVDHHIHAVRAVGERRSSHGNAQIIRLEARIILSQIPGNAARSRRNNQVGHKHTRIQNPRIAQIGSLHINLELGIRRSVTKRKINVDKIIPRVALPRRNVAYRQGGRGACNNARRKQKKCFYVHLDSPSLKSFPFRRNDKTCADFVIALSGNTAVAIISVVA